MAFCGNNKDEMVVSLAALIIHDCEVEMTGDNIVSLLTATNNSTAPYWPSLMAGMLAEKASEVIFNGGVTSGGAAPAAAASGDAAAEAAPAAKPKEEEVDALEGGMDMFGGGGGGDY